MFHRSSYTSSHLPTTATAERTIPSSTLCFSTAADSLACDQPSEHAGPWLRAVPPAILDRHRGPRRRRARSDIDTVCHVTVASSCRRDARQLSSTFADRE
ncbi:hypothetical protein PVAP13_9NG077700 [Panicum virgatum]|uniref:Uncharacterized protein n=1 Tax=Panicum virgatum TaxID=38727 RepID=A0A8T0ME36_PANVG|nr:hypothetical protein PVAP13_9NG077700 [Panicum virgatum]